MGRPAFREDTPSDTRKMAFRAGGSAQQQQMQAMQMQVQMEQMAYMQKSFSRFVPQFFRPSPTCPRHFIFLNQIIKYIFKSVLILFLHRFSLLSLYLNAVASKMRSQTKRADSLASVSIFVLMPILFIFHFPKSNIFELMLL
jgi:ABC-type transport system involved in cytochrome bd biosynthesis fused ATPase/permease subunit